MGVIGSAYDVVQSVKSKLRSRKNMRRQRRPERQCPLFEVLEQRLYLSATAAAFATSTLADYGPKPPALIMPLTAGAQQSDASQFNNSTVPTSSVVLPLTTAGSISAGSNSSQWTVETLSPDRLYMSSTAVGNDVFFAGGSVSGGYSNTVNIYDVATNTWSTQTLSQARSSITAISVGEYAIFAGGIASGGFSNVVDIYDVATNTWSTDALSNAGENLAVAVVGNDALFAGASGGIASAVVDVFNATDGTWTKDALTLSQARDEMAVAVLGNDAIFAGGSYQNTSGQWVASAQVDIFDLSTGTHTISALTQARSGISVVTVNGLAIFAGGGYPNSSGTFVTSNVVDIYSSSGNIWSHTTLSQARSNMAAVAAGNYAIFAGGNNSSGGYSSVVNIYNASTGGWTNSTLSQGRNGIAALTLGDQAIFAGGSYLNANNQPQVSSAVDIFNASTGAWSTAPLPSGAAASGLVGAIADGEAVFSGGYGVSGTPSGFVDIFPALAGVLSIPTGVTASQGAYTSDVLISWDAVNGATSYQVWRSTTNDSSTATELNADVTATTFSDITATPGKDYWYWITASDAGGSSGYSSAAEGYADLPAPTGLTATYVAGGVQLSWTAVTGASSYVIYRGTSQDPTSAASIADVDQSSYTDTSVGSGTTYYYWVTAADAATGTGNFNFSDGPAVSGYSLISSSTLDFNFTPEYNSGGNVDGYTYTGATSFGVNINAPLVLDATFNQGTGSPPNTDWNSVTDWGNADYVLAFITSNLVVQAVINSVPLALGDLTAAPGAITSVMQAINALQHLGPTERNISLDIGDFSVLGYYNDLPLSASVDLMATDELEWNVTIPAVNDTVQMDQSDVVLNGLTIDTGGSLSTDGNNLTINNASNGQLSVGTATGTTAAILDVPGGTCSINVPATIYASGTLAADGGAIDIGSVATVDVTNNGALDASGGSVTVEGSSTVANSAVMEATNGGTLSFSSYASVSNGNGTIEASGVSGGYASVVNLGGGATINGGVLTTSDGGYITATGTATANGVTNAQTISISAAITGTGGLTITGGGTANLAAPATYIGPTSIQSGNLTIDPGGTINGTSALTIAAGAKLNLTNTNAGNGVIIDYGSGVSPNTIIQSYIANDAITAPTGYAVGYADGADGVVNGLSAGQEKIMATLPGDTTLAGTVNLGDVSTVYNNVGITSGATWVQGDFTASGAVTLGDLTSTYNNVGLSLASGPAISAGTASNATAQPMAAVMARTLVAASTAGTTTTPAVSDVTLTVNKATGDAMLVFANPNAEFWGWEITSKTDGLSYANLTDLPIFGTGLHARGPTALDGIYSGYSIGSFYNPGGTWNLGNIITPGDITSGSLDFSFNEFNASTGAAVTFDPGTINYTAVPEPATLALFAFGGLGTDASEAWQDAGDRYVCMIPSSSFPALKIKALQHVTTRFLRA